MIGKTKTAFLVMLVAMMALPFSMTEPAEAIGTPEQEAEMHRLLNQLFDLYDEKEEPKENSRSKRSLGEQNQLDREIDLLWSQYESLKAKIPEPEPAEIEPELRAKMELAEESIWDSEHFDVLLGWGINNLEGVLYIQVDKDQSGNITEELQAFVGADVPLKVVYQEDVSQHQSRYCDNSEKNVLQ